RGRAGGCRFSGQPADRPLPVRFTQRAATGRVEQRGFRSLTRAPPSHDRHQLIHQRHRPGAVVLQRVHIQRATAAARQYGTTQPQARTGHRYPVADLEASQLTPAQPGQCKDWHHVTVAVSAYLADHRLTDYVQAVLPREDHEPERLKPRPYRVREAVGMLGGEGGECAFIGDSPSDVLAGHLAGVPVIGYANKPCKVRALADVKAATVTTSLAEVTTALRHTSHRVAELTRSLDQAAPRSGAGPGVSAAAQPWEARAAHAGPQSVGSADQPS